MAKYKKVYEIVIEKAVEIIKQYPDGIDYGSLTEKIFTELPEIQKNSVHGAFSTYFKIFPKNVVKPRRGFFIWVDDKNLQSDSITNQNRNIENALSVINGKILFIRLKNFRQFKDIELNLTIPEGDDNSGQPLEKICLIGQSGTGKTTLLNLIRYFILSEPSKQAYHILDIEDNAEIEIEYLIPDFARVLIFYKKTDDKPSLTYTIKERLSNLTDEDFATNLSDFLKQIEYRLIYFPSDAIKKLDTNFNKADSGKFESLMEDKVWDFDLLNPSYIWDNIIEEIIGYNKQLDDRSKIMSNAIMLNPDRKGREKAIEDFTKWTKENSSPIVKLADEYLNKFLNKFGVRVKTQLAIGDNNNFITLETNDGKELRQQHWSTGTQQIVIRGMPLYQIKPQNTIILFDEPENSLYPDVQQEIIEFYTSITKNTQFFFATHSPIIASSFKPWEIVELKFDEQGCTVNQEKYYEGNRHVDNYFKDPRYLRWDSIYQEMFGVGDDGNEEFRNEALPIALNLRDKLDDLKKENKVNTNEYKTFEKDFIKWSKKLGFDL